MTSIGLLSLIVFLFLGIAIGESPQDLLAIIICLIIFLLTTFIAIRFHKIQAGAIINSLEFIFILNPAIFFLSGGMNGGAPMCYVFCAIYVCMAVRGRAKAILLILNTITIAVYYYVGYHNPTLIISHTRFEAYLDSLGSAIIVTAMICLLVLFQNHVYDKENITVKKQNREIDELNKAQNRFFSSMSHEIRTPINTIIGLNEMILREDISDEVAEDAKAIQGAGKMLLSVINDILDMSKIESGNMEITLASYDTGDMLSDLVNMIWNRAREKGLEFHVNVDSTIPKRLIGDEVRIKQILVNLLNNAVKYTREGSVTLSLQCTEIADKQVTLVYSVADTGIGIKKENISSLFDAFRRVDLQQNRQIEGTGLGLAIVKQLVALMDGEISVNSIYTRGSTFTVKIRQGVDENVEMVTLDIGKHKNLRNNEHYRQSFEAAGARLLVVDDNVTNLMVVKKLLRDTKITIDTAESADDCLRKSLEYRYDAIFMDHLMPKTDGIECLHLLRSQVGGLNNQTPVVVLTANSGSENQLLYEREGFDGYLLKPVGGRELEEMLIRVLPPSLVRISDMSPVIPDENLYRTNVHKRSLIISSESVCDLPAQYVKKYNIHVIPFHVCTEEGIFLDGIETDAEGILEYTRDDKRSAHSDPPSVEEYQEFFARELVHTQQVLHITLAKNTSRSYERALEAAKAFDNVTVVDSGHLSSGMGVIVLKACEMANLGYDKQKILDEIDHIKKELNSNFILKNAGPLVMADRFHKRTADICATLNLHPVIHVKNGRMKPSRFYVGNWEDSWKKYIRKNLKKNRRADKKLLFITYTELSENELLELRQMVQPYQFEEVIIQQASAAISVNSGPGCIGLMYWKKENS
ncbi:MAG: DegV family EDD domain-containing protein [Lachnospiraceae bacterium]|nr:DegV family EDD domain-containing protein [Lachnospiraceae bacterium]